jgi:hypothetical protein
MKGLGAACMGGVLLLALAASPADAQLVFGSTTTNTANPSAFYLDVDTMQLTTLWNSAAQKKVNGLAADPASGRLYSNDAARLNYWEYGSVGTHPTLIAGMYRTNDNVSFAATGVDALAFANGKLYGATSFGSTTFDRGIYEVSTVSDGAPTPHCVMTPLWLDPTGVGSSSGTIDLEGLDFNPADNKFYATQTADTIGSGAEYEYAPGIYSIDAFGTGEAVKVADFPAGAGDVDGLAIGGGKFWLTEQVASVQAIHIYPYDPLTGTYEPTIVVPLADTTNRATGAAWAPGALLPEPTSLALLGLGFLVAGRRGRR